MTYDEEQAKLEQFIGQLNSVFYTNEFMSTELLNVHKHHCREVTTNYLKTHGCPYLVFRFSQSFNIEKVRLFFELILNKLPQEAKIKVFDAIGKDKKILAIKLTEFWHRNYLRASLLTFLLRMSVNFRGTTKDDALDEINKHTQCSGNGVGGKDAIKLFLNGSYHCVNLSHFKRAPLGIRGWFDCFRIKPMEKILFNESQVQKKAYYLWQEDANKAIHHSDYYWRLALDSLTNESNL